MPEFLGLERLSYGPWQAFERALQRLLVHAGFQDVRLVGGTGDGGADIVAERDSKIWVVQAKFRSLSQYVGPEAIGEVTSALDRYRADVAVVAANTGFTSQAIESAKRRRLDLGAELFLWPHSTLVAESRALSLYAEHRDAAREYQLTAIRAINDAILQGARRGLVYMATGLGKTRVAAGVIEQWMTDRPTSEVLVLVPTLALVPQFESALWPYLPKTIPTHVLTGSEKPAFGQGVTVATYQSAVRREDYPGRFGLVIVDEAHHAPADGFAKLLDALEPHYLLGLTATPWRGDERHLADIFGEPTFSVSIVEGMQLGYLAQVDYRMLIDNIDWTWVHEELKGNVSIRELNKRLFIPELDEAVAQKISSHLAEVGDPRAVVFCRSVEHADRMARFLKAQGWAARVLHSQLDRVDATQALREFRAGKVPIIVAVDILNEGIDIPDVNLLVFLRVTHSRRIFVQQLGRGLRLREGKSVVRVLDFVSDIRRVAAALALNDQAHGFAGGAGGRQVLYPAGQIVKFEGDSQMEFFLEYLKDAANLEDSEEGARLAFPDSGGVGSR